MKRVLAFLLCLCMVLAIVPNNFAFVAKADELTLDASKMAACPACGGELVVWTAYSGSGRLVNVNDGSHKHIYLSKDSNVRVDSYFAKVQSGSDVCLHLNGHSLSYDGYIQVTGSGSTLNIMGTGNLNFTGTSGQKNAYWTRGIYVTSSAALNLLGGTYNVTETALESDCPMIWQTTGTNATVTGATVNGTAYLEKGNLNLKQAAVVENIRVEAAAKLTVAENWTGSAAVSFAAGLENNLVPEKNGKAEGAFTGKLSMPNDVTLIATEAGRLQATGFNAGIALDESNQARCEVCDATVTWEALNDLGSLGTIDDGTHRHYYLTAALDQSAISTAFGNIQNTAVCLHLNGFNLTHGSYIAVGEAATLNILGVGNVNFTAATTGGESIKTGGIYVDSETANVNLYGGTFGVSDAAATEGRPSIYVNAGQVTAKNAIINGTVDVKAGVFTLDAGAVANRIYVQETGKLYVKANWTGKAAVSFVVPLDKGVVPTANGEAEGIFTGSLSIIGGRALEATEEGTLAQDDPNKNLRFDENNQALCPQCNEVVTWTALTGSKSHGEGNHYHYYLADDLTVEKANQKNFIRAYDNSKICLHLNGHNITYGARMFIQSGGVLSIMGHGNVTYTCYAGSHDDGKVGGIRNSSTVNLLGGTYSIAGDAVTSGRPYVSQTGGAITIENAELSGMSEVSGGTVTIANSTVNGVFNLSGGTMTMGGATNFEDLRVGTGAKLYVQRSWIGAAKVDFAAGLQDNVVPIANGEAEGSYTGKLTMADGSTLEGFSDGSIRKVIKLELDDNNQGYCPVCDAPVTWTAFSGTDRIGAITDGSHRHYYLSGDVNYAGESYFMRLTSKSLVCLHLNDYNLTYSGYIDVSGSTLNIMGTGNVTYTATAKPNYDKFGFYIRSASGTASEVNLVGGTYSLADTAIEKGSPLIYHHSKSTTTLGDVTVNALTVINAGTLILEKTATLEKIQMDGGKLTVNEGWAGQAEVSFPVALVNGAVPTANGVSTGSFIGGLVMEDGTILKGENNKLVVNDYKELLVSEDHRGYCMVCDKMVIWTPVRDGENVGTHGVANGSHTHYYIAEDNIIAQSAKFMYVKEYNTVCLHLNGKSIDVPGSMHIYKGTLNIMGDGYVDYLASTGNEAADRYLIHCNGSPYSPEALVNIYGGTYTTASGKPLIYASGTYSSVMAKVSLYGDTHMDGIISLDQAHVYLHDGAKIKKIEASNTGSVRVDESWYGTAKVSYLADMFEKYVNIFNGRSTGDFAGGLLLEDGRQLIGESGKLRIIEPTMLHLNAENKGYCAACDQVVDWTAVEGNTTLGSFADGAHRHIYLSGTLETLAADTFLKLSASSDLCLHLNGHEMTYGSAILVEDGSSLNILGEGKVSFACTDAQSQGGIVTSGNVNLLGGTYAMAETADTVELIENYIYQQDGQVTVNNAVINSGNYLEKGKLVLDGSACLESVHVATAGLLSVEDGWTGEASVEFANNLTGKLAPAANVTMKNASGKLTMLDGRELKVHLDGVSISDLNVPDNLTYRLYDTYAEIISHTGSETVLLPTQIAGKPVEKIATDAFANFTGTLYIGKGDAIGLAYAQSEGLTYTEIEAINGNTGYATVEAALEAYESGAVQLLADAGSITVNKDTYLDLNGFDVENVTVANGTLYVMDSQTDDFTIADGNYGKITGTVTGSVKAVSADAACAEYGYMQIAKPEGISFHCIAMDIYGVTLRPDQAGVYYDCSFAGDEFIEPLVKSYGVALSVYGAPDETRKDWCYTEYSDFQAGENDKGTLLTNVMQTGIEDIQNQANANTPIYGRAYIKTESGYIFGQTVCRDLQEQVELTDRNWDVWTKDQRQKTRAMYETYASVMGDWEIPNVDDYIDRIWFTEPAPDTGDGWEQYSLPIGNGYLGTSVFGGTESELLSLSDKTMYNPTTDADAATDIPEGEEIMNDSAVGSNGFTNLCKLYIDFGHDFAQVTNYERDLMLDTAEARVEYDYKGVTYNRTYFANYPDNVTVAKLDASQKGKLTFTLRPEATYVRDYLFVKGDGVGKTGTVTASGDTSILAGTLTAYQVNYEAQFKVIPVGGTMTANADGTITVENADSAVILISAGTNYELTANAMTAKNAEKLDPNSYPHDKVTAAINAAAQKSYEELRQSHLEDYQGIYGRVEADLSGEPSTSIPTDKQMQAYRAGEHSAYVEELLFKHGRYLLIASSREGTLPANLQGMWQYYQAGAWRGGYVYNINLQMNYWSCYATNLLDMFKCNFDYFDAMWDTLETNADNFLTGVKSTTMDTTGIGANGIAIGASGTPYATPGVNASGSAHSGPATTAYTTSLLWDYYEFTGDKEALKNDIWPYIEGAAIFLSRTMKNYDGLWLVSHSASPENNMWFGNGAPDGPDITVGTMFDQMFIYETYCQVLKAAKVLGYTEVDAPILTTIHEQIDKLDHVIVGKSGHIKEYREEEYYGEFGRYEHHGMAQLVGVYPATHVNSFTDAWQDAATVTATERGINYTGHQASFKQLVWARLGNADYAYLLAQDHISKYLRDNMWNTHTPFQIDGNFGYTAGVAEMLVQSHEGYISMLPALPKAWSTGNYKGLTARGGFEVDAAWEDGEATEFKVTSNNGGDCSVKYFNISTAKVTDSQGNAVSFTVDDRDIITFATEAGKSYTITNLSKKVVVEAPAELVLTNGTNMSWKASPDAASYNIYRAVNSQATYELVAEGVTGTSYAYVPTDLSAGDQLILRVTAVNADGVESTGIREITWDFQLNEADAAAMSAANEAYTAYTGETTKYMLYVHEERVVTVLKGAAINVYDSTDAALKAIYDDATTTENEADMITLQQATDSWYLCDEGYSQHTYVAFGDSITYGYDGDTKERMEKPYPTLVAETLGIGTVVNKAANGATLTAREGRKNMTERILSYEGEADIISVMLGVNDYSAKAELGNMDSRDNTTIYGSLHMAARHLTTQYPNAFIFFMTPFKYKTENNGVYNLADVAQAVKDVAAAYNIPVIDVYNNDKVNPATDAGDQIHPTQQHHIDYTAPAICELIEANYDPKEKD